jgi:hypothetical protein
MENKFIIGKTYSGKKLRDIVSKYESQEGTDMGGFANENIRLKDNYILGQIDIQKLIESDTDLESFISDEYNPNDNVEYDYIRQPILLGTNEYSRKENIVLDGYHRVLQALYNKDKKIVAFINLDSADKIRYFNKGGLIAPNGQVSNLTPVQYELVRSKEFISWFGDWENNPSQASRVVDENGEPKVMYHGGRANFNVFENNNENKLSWTIGGNGFYFTSLYDNAYAYGENVLACFIKSNYILSNGKEHAFVNDYAMQKIKSNGADGIYFDGEILNTQGKYVMVADELVVFDPNQIKLADGSNTTFDSNNNDIRYKKGGMTNKGYVSKASKIDSNELKMNLGGELAKGIKAEQEHSETIAKFKRKGISVDDIAKSIALDHIKEDSKYYTKLEKMENKKFDGGGNITQEDNTFLYKINTELTLQGKGKWESDFEIIDNRDGQEFGEDASNWIVYNNVSGTSVDAKSKKDAEDIIKNAPAYEGMWNEGEPIDFYDLNPKQQANHKEEFNRQKQKTKNIIDVGGIDIKNITDISYEDNGNTILYGTKNNKTTISVNNLSQEDIKMELDFEKQMLNKEKNDLPNLIDGYNQIKNSFTFTLKEKDDIRKSVNSSIKNIEILEKIVIPFYESKLLKTQQGAVSEKQKTKNIIDTRIKGLQIALKVAKVENKDKIEKRIKGLDIAQKIKKFNTGGAVRKINYADGRKFRIRVK